MKKIHLLINKKNIQYNIERWNIWDCPILLITGLSGSGKTTYAQKFAKATGSTVISFDVLKFFEEASSESQNLLNCFLHEHSEIYNLVKIHWCKTDIKYSNDILYNYFCNIFFDFIVQYYKQRNTLVILEGIQIFTRLHPYKTYGMPLIVIGRSCLQSNINKIKRDYIIDKQTFNFLLYIMQTYLYHIKHCFAINRYICYYEILDNFDKNKFNSE